MLSKPCLVSALAMARHEFLPKFVSTAFSGGSHISAGISAPSFYRVVYMTMDAILPTEELSYKLPVDLERVANDFENLSSNSPIRAAWHEFLLPIQTPAPLETGNVKAYFSGHYSQHGIHIQAACDHLCQFVFVCVAAPGGTNDITAFKKTELEKWEFSLVHYWR